MHYAIVEDLILDQNELVDLIQKDSAAHEEPVEISCYPSGESFLTDFHPGKYSTVFLDILMDGMTGIETARKIRETDTRLPIIFTTTAPDFALDGYEVHALQYLVKPVDPGKLARCLDELREELAAPMYIEVPVVTGPATTVTRPVMLDELLYAEAIRHGLVIHTTQGDLTTNMTLSELVRLLPNGPRFYEYGRGMLVNFSQVLTILENGEIRLKDGQRLYCSRRKQKEAPAALAAYLFAQLRRGGGA